MKRYLLTALAGLALAFAPKLQAQNLYDYWIQCTPGSLRICTHTEIGFAYLRHPTLGELSLLMVRIENMQGQPGFGLEPAGFIGVHISGLEVTGAPADEVQVAFTSYFATEGNVVLNSEAGPAFLFPRQGGDADGSCSGISLTQGRGFGAATSDGPPFGKGTTRPAADPSPTRPRLTGTCDFAGILPRLRSWETAAARPPSE